MPNPSLRCARAVLAFLLLFLCGAGCRGGVSSARFQAWDARCAEWIERASVAKVEVGAQPSSDARDEAIAQWDELLQALTSARAAGALAHLANDARGLGEIERDAQALAAHYPELEP